MDRKLILIIAMAFAVPLAFSLSVTMDVGKELDTELKTADISGSNGVYTLSIELYNSGSIAYVAKPRIDLFENGKKAFTSWGSPRIMIPGTKETIEIHAITNRSGNFTPRLRIYFANELLEKWYPAREFMISERHDAFTFSGITSGKDYVEFDISSDRDADVILIPDRYPPGWEFPYSRIQLKANKTTSERMSFIPDVMKDTEVSIIAVSSDGVLYDSQTIQIKKDEESLLSGFISFLGSVFRQ